MGGRGIGPGPNGRPIDSVRRDVGSPHLAPGTAGDAHVKDPRFVWAGGVGHFASRAGLPLPSGCGECRDLDLGTRDSV
jgi:hypothetical protein